MKPKNDGLGFVMKDYVITLKLFTVASLFMNFMMELINMVYNQVFIKKSYPLTGMLFFLAASQTVSNLCRLSDMEQLLIFFLQVNKNIINNVKCGVLPQDINQIIYSLPEGL